MPEHNLTNLIPFDTLDHDGAIAETAEEALGSSRGDFLRRGAVGGLGLVAGSGLLAGLPTVASAKVSKGDKAILNFALTLEYLEAAFYTEAVKKGKLHGPTEKFARIVARHERTHVAALKKTLGKAAVAKPKFDFQGTTANQKKFQATSFVLENTGVHAYLGQAGNLKSGVLLGVAATIVTIEARHAAAIAEIIGKPITPNGAFDTPLTKKQVLRAVKKTKFIVG